MDVARVCVASLTGAGCVLPTWLDLVEGVRPPIPEDAGDPFEPRQGWQRFAANTGEEGHLRLALPATATTTACFGSVSGRTPLVETMRLLPEVATHQVSVPGFPSVARRLHLLLPSRALSPGHAVREAHACRQTCSRFGTRSPQPPRWPSPRGCGRRAVAVWWGPS